MKKTLAEQTFEDQTNSVALTGLLFDRVGRLAAARYPHVYGELGIPKQALVVLVALATDGPLRQARLAERTGIDRATLVALLNELEQKRLARREPDPSDRRAHAVTITPAGSETLGRAAELAAGDDVFAALTPAEHATLDSLLRRLIAANEASAAREQRDGG